MREPRFVSRRTRDANPMFCCLGLAFSFLHACSNEYLSGGNVAQVRVDRRNDSRIPNETILQKHANLLKPKSDASANRPAGLPSALHFQPEVDQAKLLPFALRRAKVAWITGAPASAFSRIDADRYLLGDHDFARGIKEQVAWSDAQIRRWMEGLLPICESSELQARSPWPAQGKAFLETALGRPATAGDEELLAEIGATAGNESTKVALLCLAVLSSLEFNTK
jgi:hypothetical protein